MSAPDDDRVNVVAIDTCLSRVAHIDEFKRRRAGLIHTHETPINSHDDLPRIMHQCLDIGLSDPLARVVYQRAWSLLAERIGR